MSRLLTASFLFMIAGVASGLFYREFTSGFADATRIALLLAVVFLVLGLVGAMLLRRAAARSAA